MSVFDTFVALCSTKLIRYLAGMIWWFCIPWCCCCCFSFCITGQHHFPWNVNMCLSLPKNALRNIAFRFWSAAATGLASDLRALEVAVAMLKIERPCSKGYRILDWTANGQQQQQEAAQFLIANISSFHTHTFTKLWTIHTHIIDPWWKSVIVYSNPEHYWRAILDNIMLNITFAVMAGKSVFFCADANNIHNLQAHIFYLTIIIHGDIFAKLF